MKEEDKVNRGLTNHIFFLCVKSFKKKPKESVKRRLFRRKDVSNKESTNTFHFLS